MPGDEWWLKRRVWTNTSIWIWGPESCKGFTTDSHKKKCRGWLIFGFCRSQKITKTILVAFITPVREGSLCTQQEGNHREIKYEQLQVGKASKTLLTNLFAFFLVHQFFKSFELSGHFLKDSASSKLATFLDAPSTLPKASIWPQAQSWVDGKLTSKRLEHQAGRRGTQQWHGSPTAGASNPLATVPNNQPQEPAWASRCPYWGRHLSAPFHWKKQISIWNQNRFFFFFAPVVWATASFIDVSMSSLRPEYEARGFRFADGECRAEDGHYPAWFLAVGWKENFQVHSNVPGTVLWIVCHTINS